MIMGSNQFQCWACTLMTGLLLWLLFPQLAGAAGLHDAASAMQRGEFKAAERQYRQLLKETPDDPSAQMGLASSLVAQQRRMEARVVLEALVSRHSDFQPAYYLLGVIYEGEG